MEEVYKFNPFIKGYISDEDRKKKLLFTSGKYKFTANRVDLYDGLTVTFIKDEFNETPDINSYSHALADFMMNWEVYVRQHLNGFCGFDCIKFNFMGFGYIKIG